MNFTNIAFQFVTEVLVENHMSRQAKLPADSSHWQSTQCLRRLITAAAVSETITQDTEIVVLVDNMSCGCCSFIESTDRSATEDASALQRDVRTAVQCLRSKGFDGWIYVLPVAMFALTGSGYLAVPRFVESARQTLNRLGPRVGYSLMEEERLFQGLRNINGKQLMLISSWTGRENVDQERMQEIFKRLLQCMSHNNVLLKND